VGGLTPLRPAVCFYSRGFKIEGFIQPDAKSARFGLFVRSLKIEDSNTIAMESCQGLKGFNQGYFFRKTRVPSGPQIEKTMAVTSTGKMRNPKFVDCSA
jgi:hypothetical protein